MNITIWTVSGLWGDHSPALRRASLARCRRLAPRLARRPLPHRPAPHRTAYASLATVAALLAAASPALLDIARQAYRDLRTEAATYHLSAPRTFAGMEFPSGSTVHLDDNGHPTDGHVPVPTMVAGLPVIGDFVIYQPTNDPSLTIRATLALPAAIRRIPCGPGPVTSNPRTTRCIPAHEIDFAGHTLAAGRPIVILTPPDDAPARLRLSTLARPELLFDVEWPAGTIIDGSLKGIRTPPAAMAHAPSPAESDYVMLCIPPGTAAQLPDATLSGAMQYGVFRDGRSARSGCSGLPWEDRITGHDGHAQVGTER